MYGEPDIPANIFSHLPFKDLCQAELVCSYWRNIVIEEHVWKSKLQQNFNTISTWKLVLKQHDWNPAACMSHEECKAMFMKISCLLGPQEITDSILECITDDTVLDWKNGVSLIHRALPLDEENFKARRFHDQLILMSKMPTQSRGLGLPRQKSNVRKTTLSHDGEHYSNLIVFGPTAFPILVTNRGYVAVAGARYGKGRLVVVPHEAVLTHGGLMQGAVEWCANKKGCPISVDPLTKAWTSMGWQYRDVKRTRRDPPFPVSYVSRDNVTKDIPVYITEGHYEDHADHLIEYVKNGGGLIVGGRAWWWGMNDMDVVNGQKCSLLEHPGNKIISKAGIVFSREGIQQNTIEFLVDNVPALKYSLYYALKACILRPSSIMRQYIFDELLKRTEYEDLQIFSEQLRDNDHFKLILEYMYEIQRRRF